MILTSSLQVSRTMFLRLVRQQRKMGFLAAVEHSGSNLQCPLSTNWNGGITLEVRVFSPKVVAHLLICLGAHLVRRCLTCFRLSVLRLDHVGVVLCPFSASSFVFAASLTEKRSFKIGVSKLCVFFENSQMF